MLRAVLASTALLIVGALEIRASLTTSISGGVSGNYSNTLEGTIGGTLEPSCIASGGAIASCTASTSIFDPQVSPIPITGSIELRGTASYGRLAVRGDTLLTIGEPGVFSTSQRDFSSNISFTDTIRIVNFSGPGFLHVTLISDFGVGSDGTLLGVDFASVNGIEQTTQLDSQFGISGGGFSPFVFPLSDGIVRLQVGIRDADGTESQGLRFAPQVYYHNLDLTRIRLFDSQDQLLTGLRYATLSGASYPFEGATHVPEPRTVSLVGLAVILVSTFRTRLLSGRHHR